MNSRLTAPPLTFSFPKNLPADAVDATRACQAITEGPHGGPRDSKRLYMTKTFCKSAI